VTSDTETFVTQEYFLFKSNTHGISKRKKGKGIMWEALV
jgi:hypothetical protein